MSFEPHETTLAAAGADLIARMRHAAAFPLITLETDTNHVVIFDRAPNGEPREKYYIPAHELTTIEGIAFWMRQLAPKNWITTRHFELLASLILDRSSDMRRTPVG